MLDASEGRLYKELCASGVWEEGCMGMVECGKCCLLGGSGGCHGARCVDGVGVERFLGARTRSSAAL